MLVSPGVIPLAKTIHSTAESRCLRLFMDLVLRGAHIVDGSGAKAFRADLGVEGDSIVAIGDLGAAQAGRIVDVTGLVAAPGFIDVHSHSDLTLAIDPSADSKVRQGITTEVIGQCGLGMAPIAPNRKDEFCDYMSGIFPFLPMGRMPEWSSVGEYLSALERQGLATNVIPLVPHGILRLAVMGLRAGSPTDDELNSMGELLAESLRSGAWGMSTGLIYPPGIYSSTEELVSLARVLADQGGVYFTHIRGEGEKMPLLPALEEAITVGRRANVPVQISHFKQAGRKTWPKAAQALSMIDDARDEGLDVAADIYPYCAGCTLLASLVLPEWAQESGPGKMFSQSLNQETRGRLRRAIEEVVADNGATWDEFYLAVYPGRTDCEGLTIDQLAQEQGREPEDAVLDILADSRGSAMVNAALMNEDNVRMGLRHPAVMIGSDGEARKPSGPLATGKLHPRSYGSFPRVLGHYVRELGLLTLEQAVHKMTGLPAQRLGLRNRGRLTAGFKADIVVFDPQTVLDTATYADPYRYPVGIEHVLVNGQVAVEAAESLERFPGKVLRK